MTRPRQATQHGQQEDSEVRGLLIQLPPGDWAFQGAEVSTGEGAGGNPGEDAKKQ